MKSAIAVLTYRRLHALQEELKGLAQHCSNYPIAVFEDMGQRDGTTRFLSHGRVAKPRPDLLATEMVMTDEAVQAQLSEEERLLGVKPKIPRFFIGERNLGVSGNSNRAIRWFLEETDADHLCLLNDDLHILGDFAHFYQRGHADLDVGMFCFLPTGGVYDHESYKFHLVRSRGYNIRLMPRLTGIMISLTRKLLEKVGYFDTRFGKFGEEHCDFTYRCRFAGGIKLEGQDQPCLDIQPDVPLLKHQDVETSVTGPERQRANAEASTAMRAASQRYFHEHYHRPFRLVTPKYVGTFGGRNGMPFHEFQGHALVTDLV
jgi:GT2 family glycosyltransferase